MRWSGSSPGGDARLAGVPEALALPTDRPRPLVQSYRGATLPVELDPELGRDLAALGRREGATLFMVLLAGFQALLQRWSGQDDLCVGTAIAGRNRLETEGLIGLFVNSLALRADLATDPDVRGLLAQAREATLGAYAHQDLPFERLVEELRPERSLSHAPIFQVMLILQNTPAAVLEAPGLRLRSLALDTGTSKLDISLSLEPQGDGIAGTLEYATDLFDEATVRRLTEHLRTVLAGLAAGPGQRLSDLPLLSAAEQRQLQEWNATRVDLAGLYDHDTARGLHGLVERQVVRTPGAVALIFDGETLTYADLDRQANRLAHRLRKLGVGPEVRVGVCAERSLELVVGLLGVLKAGGAFVPLDPSYPAERLAWLFEDGGFPVLLTQRRVAAWLPSHDARIVFLEGEEWRDEPDTPPAVSISPKSLAYVVYTSGSTGRPKGAMNTHGAIVNRLLWMRQTFLPAPDEVCLQKTPLGFDVVVAELFAPLVEGARLVVAAQDGDRDLAYLVATIGRFGITAVQFVPSHFSALLEQEGFAERCGSLRRIDLCGEALAAELAARTFERCNAELLNLYGPAEAAVAVTVHVCRRDERGAPPLGRPLPNVTVWNLDRQGNLAPVGVPGDLHIGGVQLGRGYLNRPDLTADRFVPDPFGDLRGEPGARLYRTGDLARRRADGVIEYLGRLDHQVKVRGVRVELGEIETVLASHPEIREAVVVARTEKPGDVRLIACAVPEAGTSPASAELRIWLRDRLPEAMIPGSFVLLDAMPVTPNGKADRGALMRLETAGAGAEEYVPPRGRVEEALAAIWKDVLGVERVGARDQFFELGGHSLLATRVTSRVRGVLGVELPVRALFEHPVLADLAATVRAQTGAAEPQRIEGSAATTGDHPLSFAQQRLWFLDQLEPGNPAYNVYTALRLTGRLDRAALEASLGGVVARHAVLRTVFVLGEDDAEPVQRIAPPGPPAAVPLVDLTGVDGYEVGRLAQAEARRPFDLTRGPLLRIILLRLGPEDHAVLLTMHHIVSDGWSLGLLIDELAALYTSSIQESLPSLPPLPLQYADFARWQRTWLSGAVLHDQLGWWRERLAGAPPALDLPADHPRPPQSSGRGGMRKALLPVELSVRLAALARHETASLFMMLFAGFAAFLGRLTGRDDLVVGTDVANRNRAETEGLIGFFVNELALRVELTDDPTLRGLLVQVRETTLGAYAYQDLPFERLVEELRPERDLSRQPIFQVAFTLQNAPRKALELPGLTLAPIPSSAGTARLDLALDAHETPEGITLEAEYSSDLFEPPTVDRLLRSFAELLAAAVDLPDARLSGLPLLPETERQQVLVEWNDATVAYPLDAPFHELFLARAAAAPGTTAAVCRGERLTYGELARRSSLLARRLNAAGLLPDTPVPLLAARGLDFLTGILGTLCAGGAYLPLDPAHPAERWARVIADSRAGLVLVEKTLLPALEGVVPDGVRLLVLEDLLAGEDPRGPLPQVDLEQLAYVLYTSGSTGMPKGAMIGHRALLNHLWSKVDGLGVGPSDRVAQTASQSFDVSVWQLLAALLGGGEVHIVPPEVAQDPGPLLAALREAGITFLEVVPSLMRLMLEELEERSSPLPTSLRWLIPTGEALPPDLCRAWLRLCPDIPLLNAYGPTECADDVCLHPIRTAPDPAEPRVPIGRPVANFRLLVLDRALQPLPIGAPGELYIGGAGLGRGYLHDSTRTAGSWRPDPFAAEPGGRLYKTGDLARLRADGTFDFLGRADHQVKVRGNRIELGEIEAALTRHPSVREAVVLALRDRGESRLAAFVTPAAAADPSALEAAGLRNFLAASLPDPMVPAVFVVLAEMPLTPNGKVDRRALERHAPAPGDLPAGIGSVPPRDEVEEELAEIWSSLLGVERVSVHDDFFALGGHSLMATRAISRVRKAFGVDVPLAALFAAPTVAGMADRIKESTLGCPAGPPPLRPVPRDRDLPLSLAQQRLWFFDQLAPGSPLYNIAGVWRLTGRLDIPALVHSVRGIVRRHEALRTTFPAVAGRPVQAIAPPSSTQRFAIPLADLAALPAETREEEALRLAFEDGSRGFDLAAGPLLRVTLARLATEEHLLLFNIHHIVSDGWSLGVFKSELAVLYTRAATGDPEPLPELPVQYADFAVWQREWLAGGILEEQLAWWKQHLEGAREDLELPFDRPRPAALSGRGSWLRFVLPGELAAALHGLARRDGGSLFMILLAALEALLFRYTRQEDLSIGTASAGRGLLETEGLIGFFVNTLVMRADLAGDPAFLELVRRVRGTALEAQAHQDLPFDRLVEEMRPDRSLAHAPLFQAMFLFQNVPAPEGGLPGLELRQLRVHSGTSKVDLMLAMEEEQEGLAAEIEYSTDLFDSPTIERLATHFRVLLEGAAAEPGTRLSDLPLLSAPEQEQLLRWNDSRTGFASDLCLHQLVERHADRTPGAAAVVCGGASLTYAELDGEANRLARRLRELGVGPETRVGICTERSLDMVVGLLAILKAGGAYVPLDPSYPAERLAAIVEDAQAPIVLTHHGLADRLPASAAQVIDLDEEREALARMSAGPLAPASGPEHLAYTIFTSGSTGRPKGVQIGHRSIVHLVETSGPLLAPLAEEPGTWTVFHSYAFDYSVWEIWTCLGHGGRLVLVPVETTQDPAAFHDLLAAQKVTVVHQTPAASRHLVSLWESGERNPADLSLRRVICGGEAFPGELAGRLVASGLDLELWNFYGPTEVTVWASAYRLTAADLDRATIPLGTPLPDVRIHLLDPALQPVPAGVAGEVCIAGFGPARGYVGRPGLTAEKFVPDPLAEEPGARLYRTGDLARLSAEGRIDYLGRIDHQVKIRGFRVELKEIDLALASHPAVRQAVTLVRDGRLVAYLVGDAPPAELRGWLRERLPAYMVPSSFVPLAAFPLSPNGKVDRRALARIEPPEAVLAAGEEATAPRTPVEELVASVWCEVLGVDRVSIHESFFDAGGHSLLATQVVSRLREAFGVDLPLRALFEAPTVAALAQRLEEASRSGHGIAAPPVRRVPRDGGSLPLSFAQEWMWLIDQLDPTRSAFGVALPVRLGGRLDAGALVHALREVVRRHEVLRTTFPVVGGRPVQRIEPEPELPMPALDLSGLSQAVREEEAERLSAAELARPLDLASGPLMRTLLLRFGPEDHTLILTLHHILFDGWSGGVLLREVAALYRAFAAGEASPLPELPIQYADFAVWQRDWLEGDALQPLLAWWRERLTPEPPPLDLPGARRGPVGTLRSLRSARQRIAIPADLTAGIRTLARGQGATLFVALLAAYQTLLHRTTRQTDIAVGAPVAGRNRPELEDLIGYFVNPLVMRTEMGGDPTFRDLVGRVREVALGAWAHQDLPFTRLVQELQPERSAGRTPLFQVMLLLQNTPVPDIELPGLTLTPIEREVPLATFDLTLVLVEEGEGLNGWLWYNRDLLETAAVASLIDRFRVLLGGAVADPDRRLSDLPLLTEAERRQLLEGQTEMPTPTSAPAVAEGDLIHTLFEARVEADPEAVALVFDGEETTYEDLDQAANRLARQLRALAVGPEDRVGLCLDRSPRLVTAILATLKAGAGYLPLDPHYPADRLGFLLTDAGAKVLIAERAVADRLPEVACPVVWLDGDDALAIAAQSGDALGSVGATPASLAYVIYTSGSTGRPKGVQITHANVIRLFAETEGWFRFDERDTWTLFHSYAFDFSVWEIWGALLSGGRLVIVPWEVSRSPEDFHALLRREEVTVLNQTPSAFAALVQAELATGAPASRRDLPLKSLRWVIFGGEALNPESLRPWIERYGQRPKLVNMYGVTETSVHVTYRPIAAADLDAGSVIGEPIPDLEVRVLDERLEPVPSGVPGEMYVGGAGLTRGYLGRPELTAERFVPDPFSKDPGARLYRTGDLARLVPDGDLEYLGRVDAQVKIRGFRIEPGEIEAALVRHPAVAEAVVIAREDQPGDRRLAAYLVPDAQAALPVRQLLRYEREGRLDNRPTFELPNGMTVVHQHEGVTLGIYREIFEGEVYRRHGIDLPDGACVFDIGANMGLFTLWVGTTVPKARIFSFEPIPPTAEVLRLNASLYGLDATVYDAGIADGERTEVFTYYPFFSSTSGRFPDLAKDRADIKAHILNEQKVLDARITDEMGASTFEEWRQEREVALDGWLDEHMRSEKVACRLTTISSVIREHGPERIDLIKLDAERSELDALAGIAEEDWPKIRQFVVEVHDAGIRDRVVEVLNRRGFETVVEQDVYLEGTELYNVYATSPPGPLSHHPPSTRERGDGFGQVWASPSKLLDEVRRSVVETLPEHMVPAAFVLLEALPLTAHGKVDRRALPAPREAAKGAERPIVEPRTPVESEMVEIWKELLGVDRISIYDNFFELGGHSLLLTQLASRIRNAFHVELPLRVLFDVANLVEVTEAIAERQAQQVDKDEMAAMLDELKGLSPEEIRALLAAEGGA